MIRGWRGGIKREIEWGGFCGGCLSRVPWLGGSGLLRAHCGDAESAGD
jgi:hypothetical protein